MVSCDEALKDLDGKLRNLVHDTWSYAVTYHEYSKGSDIFGTPNELTKELKDSREAVINSLKTVVMSCSNK